MAEQFSKDLGSREDVLAKLKKSLLDAIKVCETVAGILVEQMDKDLAHLV